MSLQNPHHHEPRAGQTVLHPSDPGLAPADRIEAFARLSDPALSELTLEELLDELLLRVQQALEVDTVAILLYDPANEQLVARAAKGIEEEVEQGVRLPLGQGFAGRIAAERVAIFIADVDHADILNPILREKGIQSLLGIPLIVEGELIGVLHVGSLVPADVRSARPGGPPGGGGARGAGRSSAHGCSPSWSASTRWPWCCSAACSPSVSSTSSASTSRPATCRPATRSAATGTTCSSWPRGRLGVAIGDVVGHGVRAAALMGQLRTALHAYALQDYGPARTLELVDRFVQAMPDYAMATAAYAVLEPDTGEVQIASAGHLPPIVVGAHGGRVVDITPSAPLGAFSYGRCPGAGARAAARRDARLLHRRTRGATGNPADGLDRHSARRRQGRGLGG